MPHKGTFTQTFTVLLERPVSIEAVARCISAFPIARRAPAAESWPMGEASLLLPFRPEANGMVIIDVVNHPWPDGMGDPQADPTLFGAWAMGNFGPFAFPGGLQHASQHAWAWEEGREVAGKHQAFVRMRLSYVFGADDAAPALPLDYKPLDELQFLTDLLVPILNLPEALCYFNPNGEVLRDRNFVEGVLEFSRERGLPPLDLWSNIRFFRLEDNWLMMDTVGNAQLDLPDLEACFVASTYDLEEIDVFLRATTSYLLEEGDIIESEDTIKGPGRKTWVAHRCEDSYSTPPRRVIRLIPDDGVRPPVAVLRSAGDSSV
ncbi:MAG: DUF4261 domain-containing protein [Gemmataceae bacterium]